MVTTYDANIPYDSVIGYDGNPPIVTSAQLPSWQLEVFDPFTDAVSALPEAVIDTMSFEASAAAAVSFAVSSDTKGASMLGDLMIVRLKSNGQYVKDGSWLLRGQSWNGAKRSQLKGWTGKSLLWDRLNFTVIQDGPQKLFVGKTPGYILNELFADAVTRDVGFWDHFTWTFTATLDSNGTAWPTSLGSMEYLPTAVYADIVGNLVDKGVLEISLVGNEIRAVVPDTSGAQTSALLVVGRDVTDAPQQSSADNLISDVVIVGDDGVTVTRTNLETRAKYWREEAGISQGGTKDLGTLAVFGDVALSGGAEPKVQRTYELVVTQDRPFLPLRDYAVDDWVRTQHVEGPAVAYRVKQITLKNEKGRWTGSLVLNDKFTENELRLVKKVQGIIGGAVITGSSQTSTPDTDKDTSIPTYPITPVAGTATYVDAGGRTRVAATIQFSPPLTNTDGSPFTDPGDYRMAWRYSDEPLTAWRYLRADSPLWYLSPLDTNRSVIVVAQTIDASGHISNYSPAFAFDTGVDTTPPPAPSIPLLTSLLKTYVLEWDGLTGTGAIMPPDFNRIEVYTSKVNNFDVDLDGDLRGYLNSAGQLTMAMYGATVGETWYFKTVAVDNNGNRSAPSVQNWKPLLGVTGPDITANSITTNNIAAGAITSQLITAGAIQADRIALGQTVNLVNDPSFNNPEFCAARLTTKWTENPSRWFFKSSGVNFDTTKRNGTYLQALSVPDGTNGGRMYLTEWIYTQLGESYYFGMYMRDGEFTPTAGATVRMGIDVQQADGAILTDGINYAPLGAFWTKYEYRYTVGNPAWTKVRFWIRADNISSGDIAIDDVEVRGGVGRTEYAGSRGLLDPLGLFAWDGDEMQTVSIDFRTGDVVVAGTITSGFSGKRTVVNPGSTLLPEIRFYPTTGDLYAYVNASDNGTYPFIGVNAPDFGTSSQAMVLYDNAFMLGEIDKSVNTMVGAGVQGQGTGSAAYIWLFGKVPLASDGDMTFSSYITKNVGVSGSAFGIAVSKPPPATSGQWLLLYAIRRAAVQRFHHYVTNTTSTTESISFYTAVSGGVDQPNFIAGNLEIRYMWVRSDGDA